MEVNICSNMIIKLFERICESIAHSNTFYLQLVYLYQRFHDTFFLNSIPELKYNKNNRCWQPVAIIASCN